MPGFLWIIVVSEIVRQSSRRQRDYQLKVSLYPVPTLDHEAAVPCREMDLRKGIIVRRSNHSRMLRVLLILGEESR